jgi:magnesium chelatase family protein
LGKLSGPLLDRVDLQVRLMPVTAAQLLDSTVGESSVTVAARVAQARAAAAARWASFDWHTNAQTSGSVLSRAPWRLSRSTTAGLEQVLHRGVISARGYHRVLRTAWTIADLDGRTSPIADDVQEALAMRMGRLS